MSNLKVHKLIHTGPLIICHRNIIKIGEKSYKCDKCSSTFAHKCSLNKHTRCHSGFFKNYTVLCTKYKEKNHISVVNAQLTLVKRFI